MKNRIVIHNGLGKCELFLAPTQYRADIHQFSDASDSCAISVSCPCVENGSHVQDAFCPSCGAVRLWCTYYYLSPESPARTLQEISDSGNVICIAGRAEFSTVPLEIIFCIHREESDRRPSLVFSSTYLISTVPRTHSRGITGYQIW